MELNLTCFQSGFTGNLCQTAVSSPAQPATSRCSEHEFYSSEDDRCISCFCMGIPSDSEGTPTQCQSANLPRSLEAVEFYDDVLAFSLTNDDFTVEISQELQTDAKLRQLFYDKVQDLPSNVRKNSKNFKGCCKSLNKTFFSLFLVVADLFLEAASSIYWQPAGILWRPIKLYFESQPSIFFHE